MKNNLKNLFIKDENFFTIKPNPILIKKRGWYCRIYLEYHDAIESSFIAEAIRKIDDKSIEFYLASQNNEDDITIVFTNEDEVTLSYVHSFFSKSIDININHAGFTNENLDYLYFKDAENDIFMLFGSESFLQDAMPVNFKVYKYYYESYYGNWESQAVNNLLKRLWNDYPKI